jgi:hypothetical protein
VGLAKTRTVAPVNLGTGSETSNPFLSQLLKNTIPVKFENNAENFEDWKWEFERTCARLSQGKPMDEKNQGFDFGTRIARQSGAGIQLVAENPKHHIYWVCGQNE